MPTKNPTETPPLNTGHELGNAPQVADKFIKPATVNPPTAPPRQSGEAANEPINLPTTKHRVG